MTLATTEQTPTQAALPFAQAVRRAPEQLVLDYRSQFGTIVSASLAMELSPDYAATTLSRITLSNATAVPAAHLAALVWQDIMNEVKGSDDSQGTVLIIAGPSGSSKMALSRNLDPEVRRRADAILFTSLADALWVYKRIEEALAAREQVVIAFIHRGIHLCAKVSLQQAIDTGRTISLEDLAHEHVEAQKGIIWLNEKYRHSQRVHIGIIDATGGASEIRLASIAAVKRAQAPKDIILQQAKEAFSDGYRNQKWTTRAEHDAIFKAFTGQEPPPRTYRITPTGSRELDTKRASLNPRTLTLDLPPQRNADEQQRKVEPIEARSRGSSDSGYRRTSLYNRGR